MRRKAKTTKAEARVDDATSNAIDRLAREMQVSRSTIVRAAIHRYLRHRRRQRVRQRKPDSRD